MTGIFQIFDRYKSKSYARNDRRKSNSGGFSIRALFDFVLYTYTAGSVLFILC